MKPTWAGWPEVIAAQDADVHSTAPCLYRGRWDGDHRSWIPEVYDTGIVWDLCSPVVNADADFLFNAYINAKETDLWTPVGEEDTIWIDVQYPN